MGWHPVNLAVRFLLEMFAAGSIAYWAWTQHDGFMRYLLVIAVPLLAMAIWGIFRVPDDPGDPTVTVRGYVRLLIEGVIFGSAGLLLYLSQQQQPALAFLLIVIVHYVISYDRIHWLLTER